MRISIKHQIVSFALIVFLTSEILATGTGVTYHGRLIDPNGNPVVSSNVQFKIQLRTPGNENCLFYEEIQNKDMSGSNGIFSITINDGTGTRLDSSGYSLDQIFANRGTFNFSNGQCAFGNSYIPNAADTRKIQLLFNDGSFAPGDWEVGALMTINFVPTAIEAVQIGGYKKEQLIKIADGVSTTSTELDNTAWTEFLALINGTSTHYLKQTDSVAKIQGATLPTVGNGESLRWNSSLNSNAGGWETFTAGSGGGGGVTGVTSGTGLLVGASSGTINTSGTLNIDVGTSAGKIVQLDGSAKLPAVDGSALTHINAEKLQGKSVSVTQPSAIGHILRYDGTHWAPGFVTMTDLRSSTTGVSSFSNSCSSNQTLTYNSVTDSMSCSAISINGNQITQGVVDVTYGGTGANSASGARTNLGLGTVSTLDAGVTSGNVPVVGTGGITANKWCSANASGAIECAQNAPVSSPWNLGASSSINYTAGNVGIGTTTPEQKLDVAGNVAVATGYYAGGLGFGCPGCAGYGTYQPYAGNGFTYFNNTYAGYVFQMSGTGVVAINNTGLGVGKTNPTVALDVAGGIRPGSSTTVTSCGSGAANGEGTTRYNYTSHSMEFCNGSSWVSMLNTQSTPPPTAPANSGYFVLTTTTWTGNLGGLIGADSKCLTELTTTHTSWSGYTSANSRGILTASKVKAFLCNDTTCNNLMPLTTYYFATSGDSTAGGAYFTTNSSGIGPTDSVNWGAANRFSGSYTYWTNRGWGSSTQWDSVNLTNTVGKICDYDSVTSQNTGAWTQGASSIGFFGTSTSTDNGRWATTSDNCGNPKSLICFVNP